MGIMTPANKSIKRASNCKFFKNRKIYQVTKPFFAVSSFAMTDSPYLSVFRLLVNPPNLVYNLGVKSNERKKQGKAIATRATRAIIHMDKFARNLRAVQRRVGPERQVCVAVKADAYGHGLSDRVTVTFVCPL